jgi:hypothetical protein
MSLAVSWNHYPFCSVPLRPHFRSFSLIGSEEIELADTGGAGVQADNPCGYRLEPLAADVSIDGALIACLP